MKRVLVVDDSPVCREPIAEALRHAGFDVECAADGREALTRIQHGRPDLLLLDLSMPHVDGMAVLAAVRRNAAWRATPVVLLTDVADREIVLRARALGVRGYLLKSRFTLAGLLETVNRALAPQPAEPAAAPGGAAGRDAPQPPAIEAAPRPKDESRPAPHAAATGTPDAVPQPDPVIPEPLHHDNVRARIEAFSRARTLAGVVAEVVRICTSPAADRADLALVLKRDPVLSARVLQLANSAAVSAEKRSVHTVEDAIGAIGFGAVRRIASRVGVFDTFSRDAADRLYPLRCWQHCFAVATLMDALTHADDQASLAVAHLVGLCHDLSEILLRQVFAEEYAAAAEYALRAGVATREVEAHIFGMNHSRLAGLVLSAIGLPATITAAIREYHEFLADPTMTLDTPLARVLRVADRYAHGLLLAPTAEAVVEPFTQAEMRRTLGERLPPPINDDQLRTEVLATTLLLARLPPADEAQLARPLLTVAPLRIWYHRAAEFATLDPLGTALSSLAAADVKSELPRAPADLEGYDAIVTVAARAAELDAAAEALLALRDAVPVHALLLSSRRDAADGGEPPEIRYAGFPIALESLAAFLASVPRRSETTDAPPTPDPRHARAVTAG